MGQNPLTKCLMRGSRPVLRSGRHPEKNMNAMSINSRIGRPHFGPRWGARWGAQAAGLPCLAARQTPRLTILSLPVNP